MMTARQYIARIEEARRTGVPTVVFFMTSEAQDNDLLTLLRQEYPVIHVKEQDYAMRCEIIFDQQFIPFQRMIEMIKHTESDDERLELQSMWRKKAHSYSIYELRLMQHACELVASFQVKKPA